MDASPPRLYPSKRFCGDFFVSPSSAAPGPPQKDLRLRPSTWPRPRPALGHARPCHGCAAAATTRHGRTVTLKHILFLNRTVQHAGVPLAMVLVVAAMGPGCFDAGVPLDAPAAHESGLVPGPDARAFGTPAREFDLAVDPENRSHLALAFVIPRQDTVSPSWLALALSDDAGDKWAVRPFCGDPMDPAGLAANPDCPFAGARLTSDPVLLRLHDGALLYVGVMLRADSVEQFAARFEPGQLKPESVHVVSRSAWNFVDGAHRLPAPYQIYYNGKANVMQERTRDTLHLVWAANLIVDAQIQSTTGLPFWTTSTDGGRTWVTPISLAPQTFTDVGSIYAVGVQAFETLDGRLHATWWESGTNALYQVTSEDGGQTFTAPRKIAPAMARPPDALVDSDNLTRPWVVVDESDGRSRGSTYLLFDDLSGGDRDLYLLVSRDNATTWSEPWRLDTVPAGDGRDETMARLHIGPDGAVSILYPRWKHLERWSPYEMRLARSHDGGATFADVQLSSDFSPLHNPGDYNALALTDRGLLAVWEDGRGGPSGAKWAFQSLVAIE